MVAVVVIVVTVVVDIEHSVCVAGVATDCSSACNYFADVFNPQSM